MSASMQMVVCTLACLMLTSLTARAPSPSPTVSAILCYCLTVQSCKFTATFSQFCQFSLIPAGSVFTGVMRKGFQFGHGSLLVSNPALDSGSSDGLVSYEGNWLDGVQAVCVHHQSY